MSDNPDKIARQVLRAISKLKVTLEAENAFLRAGRPEAVAALLEEKTREIEALDSVLHLYGEAGGDKQILADAIAEVSTVISENQSLLEHSVEAQALFLKLIFSNAEEEGAKGYGATGHYTSTSVQGEALTLRSEV